MSYVLRSAAALAACAVVAFPAAAQMAFGIRPASPSNFLVSFDLSNPGNVQLVGDTGVSSNNPLAGLDFVGSTLYAYSATRTIGPGAGGLYTIDTTTGAATYVGGQDLNGYIIRDLAYNPVDQQLYGLGIISGNNSNYARMYTIDVTTGLITNTRTIWGTVNRQLTALACDSTGTFYAVDNTFDSYYRLSLNNLNRYDIENLGEVGSPNMVADQGLFIDWSRDDRAYLASNGSTSGANTLRTIDFNARTVTTIGSVPGTLPNFNQRDILDLTVAPLPAPGVLVLAGLGGLLVSKRRRP